MPNRIACRADLSLVNPALADAIVAAVRAAVSYGVVLPAAPEPEALFRYAVASAIDAIESRGDLLRRFLSLGPYEGDGPIPSELADARLSDQDCAKAITLIYSHAINCFKGQLAEILALEPCSRLVARLLHKGRLPRSTRIFLGDAAMPLRGRTDVAKGADLHFVTDPYGEAALVGVVEVKSFSATPSRLRPQLEAHALRAAGGIQLRGAMAAVRTVVPKSQATGPVFLSVVPSRWRLSRRFRFAEQDGHSFLHLDPLPRIPDYEVASVTSDHWHVTLGWSQEALASEAYSLTYWYMEQLGCELFSDSAASPWPEMSAQEAGANAAKQALYYAIRRCPDARSEQRAIALYNVYGYALGMNFRDSNRRRQMLWPEHLRELLDAGETTDGLRLRS